VRLADALRELSQVRQAWLFGSYARRLRGEPGAAPNDVDVAVVVDGDAEAVYHACARVGAELGLEVKATVFTPAEWDNPDDVFVRQLREGTLIDLLDQPGMGGSGDEQWPRSG
jgi:predicted nucleotidyltransferase